MKSFLEEYGFAILAAIVVILLIAMCTPVGNLIKQQVMNVVDSFAGRTESKLSSIDQGDVQVYAEEADLEGGGKGCKVTVLTVPSETNQYEARFSVNGAPFRDDWALMTKETTATSFKNAYAISTKGESQQIIKYEIRDKGTEATVAAGQLKLK